MAKQQPLAKTETYDLLAVLDTVAPEAEVLFSNFDSDDLLMPRLAWNLRKSGLMINGRRVENEVFVDLRSEAVLGSELVGTILFVAKGYDFRRFDGEKTTLHCSSIDRQIGYPRTEIAKPDREDGGRNCEGCSFRVPTRQQRDDGKVTFTAACMETYDILFLLKDTGEIYRMTLRGRSYRSFRPLIQRFYKARVQGRLVNIPWFARTVTARLELADKADYAICTWEVGPINDPEAIRSAAGWVREHAPIRKVA